MPIDPNNLSGTADVTFDDEFNSLSLWNGTTGAWSTGFWYDSTFGNGSTLAGNGEQEWYVNSNYGPTASLKPWTVDGAGILHLTASATPADMLQYVNNYAYVSGELNTFHSFSQTYGYFEMRAKLPAGQGMWPAFWLLPEDGSWPPELDVVEMLGANPTDVITTVHTNETGTHTQSAQGNTVANTSTAFHTYGVDWEPDFITWYFDGVPIYKVATPSDLNKPMYMVVNLAVGGYWGGNVDATTHFPADMQVDYIRAYANKSASGSIPTPVIVSGPAATGSGGTPGPAQVAAPIATGDLIKTSGPAVTLANADAMTSVLLWGGKLIVAGSVDAGWGSHSSAANEFDTTGAAAGATVTLGGFAPAGSAMTPTITGLNGGFWRVDYTGSGAPAGYEVYDGTGKQVFVVNQYSSGSPTFVGLTNGAYLSTNSGWNGRFAITEANGKVDWVNLPTLNGAAAAPTTVTALADGGFVFSYAGSNQLDRYNFNGGVHSTLTLGAPSVAPAMSVIGLPGYHVAAAWVAPAAAGGAQIVVQSFNAQGAQISAALVVAADADQSHTQVQLVATGVADQAMLFWSQGGALSAAAVNGATVSAPVTLGAATLDLASEAALSDGKVAVSWLETVNGVSHLFAEVIDPATMIGARQDLGPANGQVHLVATGSGGLALSWRAGPAGMARAYDGHGHWGAAQPVVGDFLGLDANGLIVAVGSDANGHAVLQHYDLGADAALTAIVPTPTPAPTPTPVPTPAPPPISTNLADTAANLSASLDALNVNTALKTITVSDNTAVSVSVAQLAADAHAISELANANGSAVSLTVKDTAANIAAGLGALAGASNVGSIVVSDGNPLVLSLSQISAGAAALARTGGYSLSVVDTAANIGAALDGLSSNTALKAITVSDNGALSLSASQLGSDARALSLLMNQNGSGWTGVIHDTAAAISAALDALSANAHVSAIALSDSAALSVNVARISADAAGLAKLSGAYSLAVSDSASTLSASLASLQANSHVSSVTIADMSSLSLTAAQYVADAAILARVTGPHTVNVTGYTGLSYTSAVMIYDGTNHQAEQIYINTDGTRTVNVTGSGMKVAPTSQTETVTLRSSNDTVQFASGFGNATVKGYIAGADHFEISHLIFANFSSMMSQATHNWAGVTLHSGTHSIFLSGTSMAQLNAHASDFLFV